MTRSRIATAAAALSWKSSARMSASDSDVPTCGSASSSQISFGDTAARLRHTTSRPAGLFQPSPTATSQAARRPSQRLVSPRPWAAIPSASSSQRSLAEWAFASFAQMASARVPSTPRSPTATSRRTAADGSAASFSSVLIGSASVMRANRRPTIRWFSSFDPRSRVTVAGPFPGIPPSAQARRAAWRLSVGLSSASARALAAASGSFASRASAVARVERFGLSSAATAPAIEATSTFGTDHAEPVGAIR